jgi:hypothetical protein
VRLILSVQGLKGLSEYLAHNAGIVGADRRASGTQMDSLDGVLKPHDCREREMPELCVPDQNMLVVYHWPILE